MNMTLKPFDGPERSVPASVYTPWGMADFVNVLTSDGTIFFASTPSHGGYYVANDLAQQIPQAGKSRQYVRQTLSGVWFEEDCEWVSVALTFPELFPSRALPVACKMAMDFNMVTTQTLRAWLQGDLR